MAAFDGEFELSWRIPAAGEGQLYRIGVLQIVISTLFFAAIAVAMSPRGMRLFSLAAIAPVAAFLLWLNWRRKGSPQRRPDNVRIDSRGVAWLDEAGHEHLFSREQVEAFRVGPDEDTLRPVPALTLLLAGGFESQPIELHAPADPDAVRHLLTSRLNLPQRTPSEDSLRQSATLASGVDLTFDDDKDVWRLRGARSDLLACCQQIMRIAEQLQSFPPGARPLTLRFGGTPLFFSPPIDSSPMVDGDTFCGSADRLKLLAESFITSLEAENTNEKLELFLGDETAGVRPLSDTNADKPPPN